MGSEGHASKVIREEIERLDREEEKRLRELHGEGTGKQIKERVLSLGLSPEQVTQIDEVLEEYLRKSISEKLGFYTNAELCKRTGKLETASSLERTYQDWLQFWEEECRDFGKGLRAMKFFVDHEIDDLREKHSGEGVPSNLLLAQRVLGEIPLD